MERSRFIIKLALALYCICICHLSYGHEVRPVYLEIKQVSDTEYDVLWKVPMNGGRILNINPIFPAGFETEVIRTNTLGASQVQQIKATYTEQLSGKTIRITNLQKTLVDVMLRLELNGPLEYTFLIQPEKPSQLIPVQPQPFAVLQSYLILGVEHILFGYDHLLFVLGLLLLVQSLKTLFWTITSFTVAHSITLALASLNVMSLPSTPVEAIIALSIVLLAKETIDKRNGKSSITQQYPWLVGFLFGLLHGFGFAGALTDIGFPQRQIPIALFSFNVGVELGQIIFTLVVLFIYTILKKSKWKQLDWTRQVAIPYAIGGVACFWFIQRVLVIL